MIQSVLALVAVLLLFVQLLSHDAAAACTKTRKVQIATGPSPGGSPWLVSAKKSSNGGRCDGWLFQVQFLLPNVISYSAAATIPVGGHTPKHFTISGLDGVGPDGLERVFSGYTGRDVASIAATLANGTQIELSPTYPPRRLRERYVWMRSFRYFVYYYSAASGVKKIALLSSGGRVLHRAKVEPGGTFL
jgi:hypothetical protein